MVTVLAATHDLRQSDYRGFHTLHSAIQMDLGILESDLIIALDYRAAPAFAFLNFLLASRARIL